MSIVLTRATKQAARYTDAGGRERCSGCRFFLPQGTCGRIIGPVSPRGWCKYYSMEAVQRWQPQGAIGFGTGPSLALDFMSPGTMPTGVTFARASTATYFDATGTMQTAAVNAPRWDCIQATGALRGLLIEDARTNLVAGSVSLPGWTVSGITNTGAAGIAPDGTNTMVRVAETATTGLHFTYALYTTTASTTYNASLFAKAVQDRYLQIFVDDGSANGAHATFDVLAGTVSEPLTVHGAGVIGTASIQAIGNGIYRCSISTTISTGTSMRFGILLAPSGAPGFAPSYAGNAANGLLMWGVQLEQGAFPTSYIPTTATAVTRAYDYCTIPPANMGWFVSPGGSWFAEFIDVDPLGDRSARVVGVHDGSGTTPIWVTTAPVLSTYDGAGLISSVNTVGIGAISKGASTWAAGTGKICLNGGAVATGAMATGFASLATIGVGLGGGNPGVVNESLAGYLRNVRYWPRVLSNTEMQSITT